MKKCIALLFAIISTQFNLYSQTITSNEENKYDAALNVLLNSEAVQNSSPSLSLQSLNNNTGSTIGVVVKTTDFMKLKSYGYQLNSSFGNYATVRINTNSLEKLSELPFVNSISLGATYYAVNDVTGAVTGARLLNSGFYNKTQYKGQHVLICIIDTGIDWTNHDFRDPTDTTKSRVIYIWDQTLTKQGSEETPQDRDPSNLSGLNYGVEYTQSEINNELNKTTTGFVREQDTDGHGTHVAGIAAGNGSSLVNTKYAGMAPEADLLIIKAGNGTFATSNIIDGLSYAAKISAALNEPIVVNLSLGSEDDPHDGTSNFDEAVNNFVTGANGRVLAAAAGNAGSNNIHISGTVSGSSTQDITISVPAGYSKNTGPNNDYFGFELWFNSNSSISPTIVSPNSITVTSTGKNQISDGTVYLSNTVNGNNNEREIYIYVSDVNSLVTPASGTWTIKLSNSSGSSINYHGWLFNSSMNAALSGGDNISTIESPGTATDAITVGSYVTRWIWQDMYGNIWEYSAPNNQSDNISTFSSIGPRADGVLKPDICAPGQGIVSSRSAFCSPDSSNLLEGGKYLLEQGTSMACPAVTGATALLLQQNSNLSFDQVKSYLTSQAASDNYTSTVPNNSWGYGKLNIFNSMVNLVSPSSSEKYSILAYDQWSSSSYTAVAPNTKFAVRFTPTFTGLVTGVLIHPYTITDTSGKIYFEIWTDNGGVPGNKLGSTVSYNLSDLLQASWNYINLQETGVTINQGSDYHVIAYCTSGQPVNFFVDSGSPDSRSSTFNGTNWTVNSNFNYRIRVMAASNDSTFTSVAGTFVPVQYNLSQNYPNPFNPGTTINYSIKKAGVVTLKIYDILGRMVTTLVNETRPAGNYSAYFNASGLSSGIYLYKIQSGEFVQTKKMILLK